MPDLTELVGGGSSSARPQPLTARGVVSRPPANAGGTLFVVIPNFSTEYEFEVTAWTPQGLELPQKGASCLVIFDENGDAYVPAWQGPQVLLDDLARRMAWQRRATRASW